MKKIILYIITITLIMLFPITSKALTKVNLTEDGNGKLNTTMHFEEGFVGGIDLKLKVKGNVTVKNVSFSNKIKENSFTTNYEYNDKNKTLRIIIVTGGIGSNHNLLNSKKELALGTITLNTSSKENEKYSIDIDSLKVLENNFNAKDIENITLDDNKFTYIVKKEESKTEEDKKDDESKKEDESKTEDTSQNDDNKQNDNETTSTNENNNVDNSTNTNRTSNNKNDKNVGNTSDDEDKGNNVIDNNTSEESNNDINDEVNNSNNLVYWSLAFSLLAIFIVILAVVLVKRKHKADI